MTRKGNPISVNRSLVLGAREAIQLGLVHLSLALAGLGGATLGRIPWGKGLPISSYWLVRAVFLILLGVIIRQSLVFMNTGGYLADIVRPYLQEVTDPGSGGGQPSGSSILPVFTDDDTTDRDAGSPDWGTLTPIQELPPLDSRQGQPVEGDVQLPLIEGRQGQPAEVDVVDLEAGPSNRGQLKERFIDDRLRTWRTRDQIALDREIEAGRQRIFSNFQSRVVNIFYRLSIKERGFEFPVSREKWDKAIETLLRDKSPDVWLQSYEELTRQEWIDGPFFQSVKNFLVNNHNNNKNKRRKRR